VSRASVACSAIDHAADVLCEHMHSGSLSDSKAFAESPRAPTSVLSSRRASPADARRFCQLANRATGAAVDVFGQPAQRRG
jgi:hypothetical protein